MCRSLFHFRFLYGVAYLHFLLILLAAGQLALLVQEVDEGHQQQEQQNTHDHRYHHSAGASLLLIGYSAAMEGHMEEGMEGRVLGWGWGLVGLRWVGGVKDRSPWRSGRKVGSF